MRKENLRIGIFKSIILKQISDYVDFVKLLPNTKLDEVLQEISRLDMDNLLNIDFIVLKQENFYNLKIIHFNRHLLLKNYFNQ